VKPALILAALLFAPSARDARPAAPADERPAPAQEPAPEIARLTAWPAPADADALRRDVERLRKARTPEMAAGARAGLAAAGAAAVPELLDALAKERSPEARGRIAASIGELTGAAHTRLLARELERPAPAVRIVALRRMAAFPDPGLRDAAEAHRDALGAEAGAEEVYAAALFATSTGSLAGLEELCRAAGAAWNERAQEMLPALRGARGREASALAARWLAGPERERRLGALRLLAGVGDAAAARAVVPALDDQDPAVRVAAINALRAIVDGAPPLEQLPVFEAIEHAQRWKERMR
jgi:hypothetical protein